MGELVVVATIVGILAGLSLGALRTGFSRADGGADAIRSMMAQASRLAILRQHDVLFRIDQSGTRVRVAEDGNNDGVIRIPERRVWHTVSDIVLLGTPPVGLSTGPDTRVAGSNLAMIDGYPRIIYHRDGSASSEMRIYISAPDRKGTVWRALRVNQATGRIERFRLVDGAWVTDER